MKKSLNTCPSCGKHLKISQYRCDACDININGEFEGCMFCNIDDEDRYFVLVFLQTGGNIKDVERVMGISYPTVKAKLSRLLSNLGVSNGQSECCESSPQAETTGLGNRDQFRAHIKAHIMGVKGHIREKVMEELDDMKRTIKIGNNCCTVETDCNTDCCPDGVKVVKVDARKILDELNKGNIDVTVAINRLKGKGSGGDPCRDDTGCCVSDDDCTTVIQFGGEGGCCGTDDNSGKKG